MKCSTHNLLIKQVCAAKVCKSRFVCEKCTLIHPTEHSSHYLEYSRVFDESGKVVLVKHTQDNLKQRINQGISALKTQQSNFIDEMEKMALEFERKVSAHLEEKVTAYRAEIRRFFSEQIAVLSAEQKKVNQIKVNTQETDGSDGSNKKVANNNNNNTTSPSPSLEQQCEAELKIFSELSNGLLREVMEASSSIEQKAGAKASTFLSKSNVENCLKRVLQTIDQHPFIHVRATELVPFQSSDSAMQVTREITAHSDWVNKLVYLDSRQIFASASSDSTIRIFDLNQPEDNVEIAKLEGHIDSINALILWEDNKLISGGSDKTLRIWDWQSGTLENELYGHDKPIRSILKVNKELFASAGGDRIVILWDYGLKKIDKKLPVCEDTILCLSTLENANSLAAGLSNGAVSIFDCSRGQLTRSITQHSAAVKCMLYLPENQLLATGSDDNQISLIKYKEYVPTLKLTGHKASVSSLITVNLQNVLASASWDGQIILWNYMTQQQLLSIREEQDNYIQTFIYMNDGRTIIAAGSDTKIRIWRLNEQAALDQLSNELLSEPNVINENVKSEAISLPVRSQCQVCNIF